MPPTEPDDATCPLPTTGYRAIFLHGGSGEDEGGAGRGPGGDGIYDFALVSPTWPMREGEKGGLGGDFVGQH
jgi:hypothetical protein